MDVSTSSFINFILSELRQATSSLCQWNQCAHLPERNLTGARQPPTVGRPPCSAVRPLNRLLHSIKRTAVNFCVEFPDRRKMEGASNRRTNFQRRRCCSTPAMASLPDFSDSYIEEIKVKKKKF